MGQNKSHLTIQKAADRAATRTGKIPVTGRYHKSPKKLEDDYTRDKEILGEGFNGAVRTATHRLTQERYAVKAFPLRGLSKEMREDLASECEIFLAMDHPHVARLADVYESKDQIDLVMECMTGGELFDRIKKYKRFSERDAAEATHQMLLALYYIHENNVVHRDIKLENFLYESDVTNHLKLIDFGFSKVWDRNTRMAMSCGTLAYVAPEVIAQNYTCQCDMWSLGVVVFILLAGYMPFSAPSEQEQIHLITSGSPTMKPKNWENVSKEAVSFVKSLLVVDPDERMTAKVALEHAFVVKRSEAEVTEDIADALINFGQISHFRRACMNMMAWSLNTEERKTVRDCFLAMDKDRTGVIRLAEFKQVVADQFDFSDDQALAAFSALDSNHDEVINYSDFLAAMCSTRIAIHDDLLKKTFTRFDVDNSGFITAANLREVLGESYEGGQIEALLAEADTSRDGKISEEEFFAYIKNGGTADPTTAAHTQEVASILIDESLRRGEKDVNVKMKLKAT